jgi:RpiR family carbohydrate utilization transcriptional regulator
MANRSDVEAYSVLALIRSRLRDMPPGEARVAQAILDQPYAALSWSAREMAERGRTSSATVIRACRRLGIDGLPGLRIALARELGWDRLAVEDEADGPDALLKTLLNSCAQGIATIGEHIDLAGFRRAVHAVAGARSVLFVCVGPTQVVCQDATFDLVSIGRPAQFAPDIAMQNLTASRLGPADVCFAVGTSGANKLTVGAARAAHDAGATVIAVTGYPRSALAQLADITIVVGSPDVPDMMHGTVSLVGMLLVLRALTRAVAQVTGHAPPSPLTMAGEQAGTWLESSGPPPI